MKNLIFVNGTMGAGKSATCTALRDIMKPAAFLDGDWCWDMRPFTVTDETKAMVMDNISYVLGNFLRCSEYKNIIFCWVMHEREIIDEIISRLDMTDVKFRLFTLTLSEEALKRHLDADIAAGKRCSDIFERSRARLPLYEKTGGKKVDVSDIDEKEAARRIAFECGYFDAPPSFETERLILRPWKDSDAKALYKYASSPDGGPAAGWHPHKDENDSREVIKNVLSAKGTYAVTLKECGEPVGSIGFFPTDAACAFAGEPEIGFWIGKPYWGRGLIPEAVAAVVKYCFDEMKSDRVWCSYFSGNGKSRRCQEKCGFVPHHTEYGVLWKITNETKDVNYCVMNAKK